MARMTMEGFQKLYIIMQRRSILIALAILFVTHHTTCKRYIAILNGPFNEIWPSGIERRDTSAPTLQIIGSIAIQSDFHPQGLHLLVFESGDVESAMTWEGFDSVEEDHAVRIQAPFFLPRTKNGHIKNVVDSGYEWGVQNNVSSWALNRLTYRTEKPQSNETFVYPLGLANDSAGSNLAQGAGAGVTVYVLDTGLEVGDGNGTSGEWDGRARIGHDATGGDGKDLNGHGTFVSSLIGSKTWGVAKNASIVAVKVIGNQGEGSVSDILKGLQFVMDSHHNESRIAGKQSRSIVNISAASGRSTALNRAVAILTRAGVPVVVAAGNSGVSACDSSPASAPSAITVGATTSLDAVSSFSNIGPCVDIFAPGTNITGLSIPPQSDDAPRLQPSIKSGTSFSSPIVAGIVAIFWSMMQSNETAESAAEAPQSYAAVRFMANSATLGGLKRVPPLSGTPDLLACILPQGVPSGPKPS
ncbi:peptidase S8/S53 domain-containing protein [Cladochytrium replicatum]|nr:peptidase S8/S53 domain-containing protein [Cladochytrium replicatum]